MVRSLDHGTRGVDRTTCWRSSTPKSSDVSTELPAASVSSLPCSYDCESGRVEEYKLWVLIETMSCSPIFEVEVGRRSAVVRHADRLSLEVGREQGSYQPSCMSPAGVPRRRDVRVEADDHAVSGWRLGLRLR